MDYVKIYNKYNKSINLLMKWGYEVYISNTNEKDKIYFDDFMWSAQKDGKIYTEQDPLRLLGLIILLQEYAAETATEDFDEEDFDMLTESYSLKPSKY
ncbi:hypothetical protein [Clostridium sp. MD294]|uniref:hypothetical protein n=1 Tax=Clostridium sp. MD294 TaxID=97138 RepID=UPI0002C974D1|nr:hypothetical protein [Clostridium sp. MD294]NDO45648.1 hypothetical protein [Clostridium sp. MD294]USF30697.1 hypothetical protein C820_002140 [Clostridium sp. MD294]